MKLEDKLEILLRNYIDDHDLEVNVHVDLTGEWQYDFDSRIVNVTIQNDEDANYCMKKLCDELGLNWNCPMFLISLLHEIGHDQTIYNFTIDEWILPTFYCKLKSMMCEEAVENDYMIYMRSPRELIATK